MRVEDARSGRPIAGARVRLFEGRPARWLAAAAADASGRATLDVPDGDGGDGPRVYLVTADAPAYRAAQVEAPRFGPGPIVLRLEPARFVALTGRVVALEDGRPLAGVRVDFDPSALPDLFQAVDWRRLGATLQAVSAQDGTFVLERFPADDLWTLRFHGGEDRVAVRVPAVSAQDWLPGRSIPLPIAARLAVEIDGDEGTGSQGRRAADRPASLALRLEPRNDLASALRALEGKGVVVEGLGATVREVRLEGSHTSIGPIPAGRWHVALVAQGRSVEETDVEVVPPETTIRFASPSAHPSVHVRLVDEEGVPWSLLDLTENPSGRRLADRIEQRLGVATRSLPLTCPLLVVEGDGTVRERVFPWAQAECDVAVATFPVRLTVPMAGAEAASAVAEKPGNVDLFLDLDRISALVAERCVRLRLDAGVSEGPVPTRLTTWVLPLSPASTRARLGRVEPLPVHVSNGGALLLPPGPVALLVSTSRLGRTPLVVDGQPGDTLARRVRLDPGGDLEVQVVADTARTVPIRLFRLEGSTRAPVLLPVSVFRPSLTAQTPVPPGRLRLVRMAPGPYEVVVGTEDGRRTAETVTVVSGETAQIVVRAL